MHSSFARVLKNLKNRIFPSEIIKEVAISYNHKLPTNVQVSWFRDGNFIIGNINVDGSTVMTQAESADEFVDMVNETIYAVYGIPLEYAQHGGMKKFFPRPAEFQKLDNVAIKSSKMDLTVEFA